MRAPLQASMQLAAMRLTAGSITSRIATVTSYNPNRYAAAVSIQPEGILTGFLPVAAAWMGNGWGMFCPPSPGDLVRVEFIDGDIGAGIVEPRLFNLGQQPLAVPAGEFWLVHQNGQSFKLLNSGALTLSDGHGATAMFNGDGTITSQAMTWNHMGDMNIIGTLTVSVDVIAALVSLVNHLHISETPGDPTSPPIPG